MSQSPSAIRNIETHSGSAAPSSTAVIAVIIVIGIVERKRHIDKLKNQYHSDKKCMWRAQYTISNEFLAKGFPLDDALDGVVFFLRHFSFYDEHIFRDFFLLKREKKLCNVNIQSALMRKPREKCKQKRNSFWIKNSK